MQRRKYEPNTRREQAEYVVDRLKNYGVKINGSSRIGKMLHILRRPGTIEYEDPDYTIVLESIRDMHQLRLIVDTMDAHRESREFHVALDLLQKGFALPQDESDEARGRNYQFQLYVAALCTNAGIPTRHEEPDITCTIEGSKIGIAAKRLKRIGGMKRRVRNGADQIGRAAIPGIIALDLTLAQNPTNRFIVSSLESQLYFSVQEAKYRALFDKNGASLRQLVTGKKVLALWVFESTLRLKEDQSWSHDCWSLWFDTTNDETENRLLDQFRNHFLKGVPNLVNFAADDS